MSSQNWSLDPLSNGGYHPARAGSTNECVPLLFKARKGKHLPWQHSQGRMTNSGRNVLNSAHQVSHDAIEFHEEQCNTTQQLLLGLQLQSFFSDWNPELHCDLRLPQVSPAQGAVHKCTAGPESLGAVLVVSSLRCAKRGWIPALEPQKTTVWLSIFHICPDGPRKRAWKPGVACQHCTDPASKHLRFCCRARISCTGAQRSHLPLVILAKRNICKVKIFTCVISVWRGCCLPRLDLRVYMF